MCAGKKPVAEIGPALFELSLQQQNLRAIMTGGGVVRVVPDYARQADVCLGEVEFVEADGGQRNSGERVIRFDGQGRFIRLHGTFILSGLLMALAKVVPGAGIAGVQLCGLLERFLRLAKRGVTGATVPRRSAG